jgi:hypothetical protein
VIIGNTEHLIFEAGQFKDDLTLGVLGWMDGVVKGTQKAANNTTAGTSTE